VTQVVECLPSKCAALSSNPSTTKKKKKKNEIAQNQIKKSHDFWRLTQISETMVLVNWGGETTCILVFSSNAAKLENHWAKVSLCSQTILLF
jgi:hypothetical protein